MRRFRWITEGESYLYCAAPGKGADHLRGQIVTALRVPRAGAKPSNVLVQFPGGAQHIVPLGTLKKVKA